MNYLKQHLNIINQFFEIEKKVSNISDDLESVNRNFERTRRYFEEMGYKIHNPLGESFTETRTDCEAGISGYSVENLRIKDVIKPIVLHQKDGQFVIVQKAVVVVESHPL